MKLLKSFIGVILLVFTVVLINAMLHCQGIDVAAVITLSPIMGDIAKKAGSDVFSHNHYGSFLRKLVKPKNPKTGYQSIARALITSLSRGWAHLSAANRESFNVYGSLHQISGRLGRKIHLTGEAWYVKLNAKLTAIGAALITAAPTTVPVVAGPLSAVLSGVGAASLSLTFTGIIPVTHKVIIRASKGLSAGKDFNSDYRIIGVIDSTAVSPLDITGMYTARISSIPASGSKVFVETQFVEILTGLSSGEVVSSAILG